MWLLTSAAFLVQIVLLAITIVPYNHWDFRCVIVVGGDQGPHTDMSSNILYSVLSRYLSDP
jgi:hypothetical protein